MENKRPTPEQQGGDINSQDPNVTIEQNKWEEMAKEVLSNVVEKREQLSYGQSELERIAKLTRREVSDPEVAKAHLVNCYDRFDKIVEAYKDYSANHTFMQEGFYEDLATAKRDLEEAMYLYEPNFAQLEEADRRKEMRAGYERSQLVEQMAGTPDLSERSVLRGRMRDLNEAKSMRGGAAQDKKYELAEELFNKLPAMSKEMQQDKENRTGIYDLQGMDVEQITPQEMLEQRRKGTEGLYDEQHKVDLRLDPKKGGELADRLGVETVGGNGEADGVGAASEADAAAVVSGEVNEVDDVDTVNTDKEEGMQKIVGRAANVLNKQEILDYYTDQAFKVEKGKAKLLAKLTKYGILEGLTKGKIREKELEAMQERGSFYEKGDEGILTKLDDYNSENSLFSKLSSNETAEALAPDSTEYKLVQSEVTELAKRIEAVKGDDAAYKEAVKDWQEKVKGWSDEGGFLNGKTHDLLQIPEQMGYLREHEAGTEQIEEFFNNPENLTVILGEVNASANFLAKTAEREQSLRAKLLGTMTGAAGAGIATRIGMKKGAAVLLGGVGAAGVAVALGGVFGYQRGKQRGQERVREQRMSDTFAAETTEGGEGVDQLDDKMKNKWLGLSKERQNHELSKSRLGMMYAGQAQKTLASFLGEDGGLKVDLDEGGQKAALSMIANLAARRQVGEATQQDFISFEGMENVDEEKNQLFDTAQQVLDQLRAAKPAEELDKFNNDLQLAINKDVRYFNEVLEKANEAGTTYAKIEARKGAVKGAVMATAFGAAGFLGAEVVDALADAGVGEELGNSPIHNTALNDMNGDGKFEVWDGNDKITDVELEFNNDGSMTAETETALEGDGFDVKEHTGNVLQNKGESVSVAEYLQDDHENVAEISSRTWGTSGDVVTSGPYMGEDEAGNACYVMDVTDKTGNIDVNNMKFAFSANDNTQMEVMTVDIDDGQVKVPVDSVEGSLFSRSGPNGQVEFHGSFGEVMQIDEATGTTKVFDTPLQGEGVENVKVPHSVQDALYTLTKDGETYFVKSPVAETAMSSEALDSAVVELDPSMAATVDNEVVNGYDIKGDYDADIDPYNMGSKEGSYALGASLYDPAQSDAEQFQELLSNISRSPEQATMWNAGLGMSQGEGIDSFSEINTHANELANATPEQYEKEMEGTLSDILAKMDGGKIEQVDFSQQGYTKTIYEYAGTGDDTVLATQNINGHSGHGLRLLDAGGENILDTPKMREMYGIPTNAEGEFLVRLECGGQIVWSPEETENVGHYVEKPGPEPEPEPGPGPEPEPEPEPEPGPGPEPEPEPEPGPEPEKPWGKEGDTHADDGTNSFNKEPVNPASEVPDSDNANAGNQGGQTGTNAGSVDQGGNSAQQGAPGRSDSGGAVDHSDQEEEKAAAEGNL